MSDRRALQYSMGQPGEAPTLICGPLHGMREKEETGPRRGELGRIATVIEVAVP